MAGSRKKSARKKRENMILVRGSDGALYLVSTTKAPVKVKGEIEKEIIHSLDRIEDKLEEDVFHACGIQHHVHIGVPTIFVRHR